MTITKRADDMTDDELATIAAGWKPPLENAELTDHYEIVKRN